MWCMHDVSKENSLSRIPLIQYAIKYYHTSANLPKLVSFLEGYIGTRIDAWCRAPSLPVVDHAPKRREGEEGMHGDAMETAPEGAAKEKHLLIISILYSQMRTCCDKLTTLAYTFIHSVLTTSNYTVCFLQG